MSARRRWRPTGYAIKSTYLLSFLESVPEVIAKLKSRSRRSGGLRRWSNPPNKLPSWLWFTEGIGNWILATIPGLGVSPGIRQRLTINRSCIFLAQTTMVVYPMYSAIAVRYETFEATAMDRAINSAESENFPR